MSQSCMWLKFGLIKQAFSLHHYYTYCTLWNVVLLPLVLQRERPQKYNKWSLLVFQTQKKQQESWKKVSHISLWCTASHLASIWGRDWVTHCSPAPLKCEYLPPHVCEQIQKHGLSFWQWAINMHSVRWLQLRVKATAQVTKTLWVPLSLKATSAEWKSIQG